MLNIKRENGSPRPVEGVLSSGERVLIDPLGNGRLRDTKHEVLEGNDGKKRLSITGPDLGAVRQRLIGLKRKQFPTLDVESALSGFRVAERPPNDWFNSTLDFGDPRTFRAVAKAAVGFYISCEGERSQIEHLLPYLISGEKISVVEFFYPESPVVEETRSDLLHHLVLVGSSEEKLLYCFVSYFSTVNYIVLLNSNYSGPDIAFHHDLNPVRGISENRKVIRFLSRSEIVLALQRDDELINHLLRRVDRFFGIAVPKRATMRQLDTVLNDLFASTPPQENESWEAYFSRLWAAFEPQIFPMIRAASIQRN